VSIRRRTHEIKAVEPDIELDAVGAAARARSNASIVFSAACAKSPRCAHTRRARETRAIHVR
jgi:hypothetical protein